MTESTGPTAGFRHDALLYDSDASYVDGLVPFVDDGLACGEAVFVAVPAPRIRLLKRHMAAAADRVRFADMTALGANPHRIIPAIGVFIDEHRGQAIRFVGEPIWHGRARTELEEATCHEALINVAFAHTSAHILCPYDTSALDAPVLHDAERTHPNLVDRHGRRRSRHYTDPFEFCRVDAWPLSAAPARAILIDYDDLTDLTAIRMVVRAAATAVGFGADRAADVELAVGELCANTFVHASGAGQLRIWDQPDALVCQITDAGRITDPLAGRRRADPDQIGGRGLYLVNHLADVTQIRSTAHGTTARITFNR